MEMLKCNYCGNPIKPNDNYWVDIGNCPGGEGIVTSPVRYCYIFCKESCRDAVTKAFDEAIFRVQERFQLTLGSGYTSK